MLLEMEKMTKKYGALTANHEVDFNLRKGEIHALVGENGAGKTTLMRILYGMEQPTSGVIKVDGKERQFGTPADAIQSGIGMVHQHFMLFPSFSIAENIVIGREPGTAGRFDRKEAAQVVRELSQQYGMPVDPLMKIGDCSLGVQQRVEILKVLYQGADIIVLDEPTGVLTPLEVKELLAAIKGLAAKGKSFILITHKLHEIMDVADRITVLRDGKVTGVLNTADTNAEELSRLMVGRELAEFKKQPSVPGDIVLDVDQVTLQAGKGKPLLDQISLQVRAGEIVGVAGISGNGQSELIQAITGLARIDKGKVRLAGQDVTESSVREIRNRGLAHIPEDRYMWGAAGEASVFENGLMGYQRKHQRFGFIQGKRSRKMVADFIRTFGVKTSSQETKARYLSGGNLQKLIVARELGHGTPFVIAAEPTRGVDIGAMETIHGELLRRREERGGILLISSELSEILKLSDRIVVMYDGRITGELRTEEATEEKISLLMAGGDIHAQS
ncbi:ABC transporter ATP-binding protein [Paenibacillus tuaregi]|uniref:ABC transporter ATP-binding protein n=1 Tax=Paenibacillus tuaregi TaxID=1816681 RepID=UPI00083960F4|nr:ABC transporter ATP-binding protein [Paenibacillus tuaregi]